MKTDIVKVLSAITLESTANATQADAIRVLVDTAYKTKLNISALYTVGASETSNNAYIVVYGYDGTNWIQLNSNTDTSGTITATPLTFKIPGANDTATYPAHFTADISFSQIKVTAYEDGVASAKGTLTVVIQIQ